VDGADIDQEQPWLLHSFSVGALNFCAFDICPQSAEHANDHDELLLAAPNGLDSGGIDVFHLPSERRIMQSSSDKNIKTGMVMALSIFHDPLTKLLTLASGYEDGHVMLHTLNNTETTWQRRSTSKPHSQPVLSLDVSHTKEYLITSSADAVVAKFVVKDIISATNTSVPTKTANTKHSGQQDLRIRSDGKIFATAGWDARIRVYSAKTMKELAVLKWHKDGCYAVAFADTDATIRNRVMMGAEAELSPLLAKSALDVIKQERATKAQTTHWLAAGGKDGKISLWDIY